MSDRKDRPQAAIFHLYGQLTEQASWTYSQRLEEERRRAHAEFEAGVAEVDAYEEAHGPVASDPFGCPVDGPGSWGAPIVLNGVDTTPSLLESAHGVPDPEPCLSDREVQRELLALLRRMERERLLAEHARLTAAFDARRR